MTKFALVGDVGGPTPRRYVIWRVERSLAQTYSGARLLIWRQWCASISRACQVTVNERLYRHRMPDYRRLGGDQPYLGFLYRRNEA